MFTALAGLSWATACGDGGTEPPPPEPPRPVAVTVSPATAQLTSLGATAQLSAQVLDQNGQAMAGATVTWASSSAVVATVSASGLVTAAGNGSATINATAGGVSGTATVTVAQEVSAVTVSPATDTLVRGDTLRLAAAATDANGNGVAGVEFVWASSDTLVAVVDASGLVTAVGEGEAEITATAAGFTGRAELTVVAPVPTTVAVTPDTVALTALGQTAQLIAEVRDQVGRVMTDARVSWSSADSTVATVSAAGRVRAVGIGVTAITAMAGEARGTALVTVEQSAGSVIVTPPADTIAPGDTLRLGAEVYDANGHRVEGAGLTWSSSNASVATVDTTGLVRGIAEGMATITAMAGSASGTSEITVANPDRAALVTLYNVTDGPNWVNNENWLTDAPLGDWYGVDTDAAGRVVRLDLSGSFDYETELPVVHGLAGPIPPELANLGSLRILDLGHNLLSGHIPPELGNLANLTRLWLSFNDFSGPIPPELGELASLEYLFLTSNSLSGSIPPQLGNASNLAILDLALNDLSGPIPPELGNLASLWRLALNNNDLTGPIPPELGNLLSLRQLWLRHNNLSGSIPPELGDLVGLTNLDLRHNALSGPIPQSFLQLVRLFSFRIAGNGSLCVPGTSSFVAWLREIDRRDEASSSCNADDVAALKSLFEATAGPGWAKSDGWLGHGAVEEWHGINADSLGHVTELDLTANGLVGQLPTRFGDLAQMRVLRIGTNALTGRLPIPLTELPLNEFHYAGTELCVPPGESFKAWLNTIPSHEGTGVECAPLSDREILEILYEATGGPDWTNNDNWLTDAPLRTWYGVGVGDGRVLRLALNANNLSGSIPPELGNLASLEDMWLSVNPLTGSIPPELGNLANLLTLLVWTNDLSGPIPPELGNLASLEALIIGGNNFTGSIPPELGNLANLEQLFITDNAVTGSIPPELGNLASLQRLAIRGTRVTGPIPPELGNLASLEYMWLNGNELTGPIPPQLGALANLGYMYLGYNDLTGPIPPQLGALANLEDLYLGNNNLSGPIPSELGNLSSLTNLELAGNDLSGPLPGMLGNLSTLEQLLLANNALTGPVPPEFGAMSSVKQLVFTNNPGMAGALPSRLADLRRLEGLLAEGTDLCTPSDPRIQTWLDGVFKRRISACTEGEPPTAYLTQAVQSREFPVPLVAGEPALLRVFPTARQATSAGIPAARARFYVDGREIHVENIPGKSTPIPPEVDESSLSKSANAEIPAEAILPGLEMVIEVDPDGTLDPELGVAKRIPETGRAAVDVRAMPLFDLTLIPFIWSETHDSSIVDLVGAMARDPENHEMLRETRTLLPVADLDVTAHEPVLSTTNDAFELRANAQAIRAMEGGTGHTMGMMPTPVRRAAGVAFIGTRVSFSIPSATTMAHELGHNMSLYHAPCGGAGGPDPSFPYPDGSIGAWGYDSRDGGRLVHPRQGRDLMSYCSPRWISDFSFTNALRYRLFDEGAPTGASSAARSLLVWGGVSADGIPYLEPAFVVEAPAALPDSAGDYRLVGRATDDAELFSLNFTMPEAADGDGSSSFAFILPARAGWEGNLASIILTGPDGSFILDGESDRPMAILRNPRNGQVRGILRDLPPVTQAARDAASAAGPGMEVLFSRGIPDASAWRR